MCEFARHVSSTTLIMSSKAGHSDSLTTADFHDKGNAGDKRREPRTSVKRIISIMPCDSDPGGRFQQVEIQDCSSNGIGLVSPIAMSEGERFLVKFLVHRTLLLTYTVRHCEPTDKRFRIGAELSGIIGGTKDDPDEILRMLINPSKTGE